MGIFSNLFGSSDTTTQYIYVENTAVDARIGMWAMTDQGVGIVIDTNKIVLVDDDGTNKMVIVDDKAVPQVVDVTEIVQAFIEDIPVVRRGTEAAMIGYGYKHKEQA